MQENPRQMQGDSVLPICPSFSCYSSTSFAEVATKACKEFEENPTQDCDGFAFDCLCTDHEALTISADEIFSNGQIRTLFPFYIEDRKVVKALYHRDSLRKLMNEESNSSSSSFSSEPDTHEALPGSFSVLKPKCKKSSSTGTSKRWKLRDLIRRSNSERKDNTRGVN